MPGQLQWNWLYWFPFQLKCTATNWPVLPNPKSGCAHTMFSSAFRKIILWLMEIKQSWGNLCGLNWRPLVSSPLPGTQECDSWGCSCLWWRTIQKHGYAGQSWYSWWAGTEDKAGSDLGREGRNDLDLGKIVSITSIKYSSQAHSLVFYSPIFYGRSVFNTETVSLLHLKCFHNFFEQKDADFGCDFIWSSWWTCPWRVRRQGKMLYLGE